MKRLFSSILVLATAFLWAVPVAAQQARPLRVLLTFGGHGFQEGPFFAMFDALDNVEYTKAPLPEKADLLKPGLEKQYDAIVMYDMVAAFTPEQQQAFVALLNQGIGVVSLHHNLGAHRGWEEFPKIIGGKFIFEPSTFEGNTYEKSTWSHGEDLKVTVVDREHPITQGLDDFEIHDETYGGYFTSSNVHVLLKTDHPKNDPELAWTTHYGNSRVFYLMLGHDRLAWENPVYSKLLHRGIRWAAQQ